MSTVLKQWPSLSVYQQLKLAGMWDKRNVDPLSYIPHEKRKTTTPEEAEAAQVRLGEFAMNSLKVVLREKEQSQVGLEDSDDFAAFRKVVGIGGGKAHDAKWLFNAVKARLETWWLDVSSIACDNLNASLAAQWLEVQASGIQYPGYNVVQAEIQSVLLEPESIGLNLDEVEVWYACRILGCLSEVAAQAVLYTMGRSLREEVDPEGENAIILVNALLDYNQDYEAKTSTLRTKAALLWNIRQGAGRPVESCAEDSHDFFGKTVTALTIKAK